MASRAAQPAKASRLLVFPYKGVDRGSPDALQPEGTTWDCLNVMPRDGFESRARGGPRPAFINLFSGQAAADPVKRLHAVAGPIPLFLAAMGTALYSAHDFSAGSMSAVLLGGVPVVTSGGPFSSADVNGIIYLVDGTNTLAIAPQAGTPPSATAAALAAGAGKGTVPVGCTVACNYKGRLVLANNTAQGARFIAMSRVLDPTDWDYSQADPYAAANFDQSTSIGRFGAGVSALCPLSDGVLIVASSASLARLDADPGDGGRLLPVSDKVGIVSKDAWCTDDSGNLYFIGYNGLNRLAKGSTEPLCLSRGKADYMFSGLRGFPFVAPAMAWDSERNGLWIVWPSGQFSSMGGSFNANGIFYSAEFDGFFPAAMGDSLGGGGGMYCATIYQGIPYFGGESGTVNGLSSSFGVSASAYIGPFRPGGAIVESVLTALDFVLGTVSGGQFSLAWTLYSAKEDRKAITSPQRTLLGNTFTSPGRQSRRLMRLAGGAFALKISNTDTAKRWTFDHVVPTFCKGGRQR